MYRTILCVCVCVCVCVCARARVYVRVCVCVCFFLPWLRRLVVRLSPPESAFHPGSFVMVYLVYKMAVSRLFTWHFYFSFLNSICTSTLYPCLISVPPTLYILEDIRLQASRNMLLQKKKDEIFRFHALKAYKVVGGITPLVLNLGIRWRWMVKFTSRLLYLLESFLISIEQQAGWDPQSIWTFWIRYNSFPYRDSNRGSSSP